MSYVGATHLIWHVHIMQLCTGHHGELSLQVMHATFQAPLPFPFQLPHRLSLPMKWISLLNFGLEAALNPIRCCFLMEKAMALSHQQLLVTFGISDLMAREIYMPKTMQ